MQPTVNTGISRREKLNFLVGFLLVVLASLMIIGKLWLDAKSSTPPQQGIRKASLVASPKVEPLADSVVGQ